MTTMTCSGAPTAATFPVEYRSHPLYNDGRLLGAVVTFSDITARKEAET